MDHVFFYDKNGQYFELSNFYEHKCPLIYDNKTYKTSEHLYHASKYLHDDTNYVNLEYADIIRNSKTPYMAKILANKMIMHQYEWQKNLNKIILKYNNTSPNENWDEQKIETMHNILVIKFTQDLHCRKVLLSTGNRYLIENSKRDPFWGIGKDGNGKNMLGNLLIKVRDEIRESLD